MKASRAPGGAFFFVSLRGAIAQICCFPFLTSKLPGEDIQGGEGTPSGDPRFLLPLRTPLRKGFSSRTCRVSLKVARLCREGPQLPLGWGPAGSLPRTPVTPCHLCVSHELGTSHTPAH